MNSQRCLGQLLIFPFVSANSSYTKFSVEFTLWTSRILNTDKQWLLDKNLWIFMHLLLFHDFFLWENWEYWFRWRLLSTAYCTTENSLTFDQLCFVQQKVLSFEYQLSCVSGLLCFVALWSGACFEVFMLIAVKTSTPCSTSFSKLLNVLNSVTSNQIVTRKMAWRSHGTTNEELVTKLRG